MLPGLMSSLCNLRHSYALFVSFCGILGAEIIDFDKGSTMKIYTILLSCLGMVFCAGTIKSMDGLGASVLVDQRDLLRKAVLISTLDHSSIPLIVDQEEESEEESAIHAAAREGNSELLQHYLEQGINIDEPDVYGMSPIHYAVENGHVDVITLLVFHGADINAHDATGWTALHYVCDHVL